MKNSIITSVLAVLLASMTTVRAQNYPEEYLGLPGDNLNLYAVMDLFRNSETLEVFERGLNDRESRINNLDLNGDNLVDYITVSDYKKRKVHTIVLRAVLGRNEYQDVAVITVEKLRRKRVMIQLIGDETLYGKNYIIEPAYAKRPNPGYNSDLFYSEDETVINNYYYEIYDWPVVVYINSPYYSEWHSSWYWGYYPTYWDPWSPYYWDFYYGYHSGWQPHYYSSYHHCDRPRDNRNTDYYYNNIRQHSPQVQRRLADGNYSQTYSRPDQRREGASLYTSTHDTRTVDSRDNTGVNSQVNRTVTPQPAGDQNSDAANITNRRRPDGAVTGNSNPAGNSNDNRTPATAGRRPAGNSSTGENSGGAHRVSASTETGRTVTTTTGATDTRQPVPVNRAAIENRTADIRNAEDREAENREAEARAAEERAAESRAAEMRAAENREAERRAAESRAAEAREAQNRAAEARAAESRAAEARANEARAAEARKNEAAKNSNSDSESGAGGTIRQ